MPGMATKNHRGRFQAILRQRCPLCLEGKVFERLWKMSPQCPRCQVHFEREHGFFLGAMYFAYSLGIAAVAPVTLLLLWLDIGALWVALLAEMQIVLLSPLLYRYSRVLWLHLDQSIDPRTWPEASQHTLNDCDTPRTP